MARALHLWNPKATSGELQNQAYGYLFPMGPFFAAGQALGVPMWITQRLWCALVLCLAFVGVLLLARALRIGTPSRAGTSARWRTRWPRGCSPRSARCPPRCCRRRCCRGCCCRWCRRRLGSAAPGRGAVRPGGAVHGRRQRRDRRDGAGAARAVAADPAGHRAGTSPWSPGGASRSPAACCGGCCRCCCSAGTACRSSTYIESAANTTGVLSLFQALRGTNQWVAYVVEGEPWWPAGFMLVDNPVLMVATMAGRRGRARRAGRPRAARAPVPGAGHAGRPGAASPSGSSARWTPRWPAWSAHLLDGPLAPLRNVHKFEPVLRLPIALGLVHALTRVRGRAAERFAARPARARGGRRAGRSSSPRRPGCSRCGPGPAGATCPATGGRRPAGSRPGPRRRARCWCPAPASASTPGAARSTSRSSRWPARRGRCAPRSRSAPKATPGSWTPSRRCSPAAQGSAGLAGYLARNGYRYLLLRNDIDRAAAGRPADRGDPAGDRPLPGLRAGRDVRAATRAAGRRPAARSTTANSRPGDRDLRGRRAGADGPGGAARPTSPTVSGGPESLLPLLEQGLIDRRPAGGARRRPGQRLRTPAEAAGPWLVTDGLRRRERNVGPGARQRQPDASPPTSRPGRAARRWTSCRSPARVTRRSPSTRASAPSTASTAASFADAPSGTEPSRLPFAAIDGDPATAWVQRLARRAAGAVARGGPGHPAPGPRGHRRVRRRPAGGLAGRPGSG